MGIRRKYPWITLEIAVPFDAQPERWELHSKLRYEWNLNQADIVTWVSHEYDRDCLSRRNRYMIDNCDLLLAAYDGRPGGTKHAVDYARSMEKDIRLVPPTVSETRMWIWDYDRYEEPGDHGSVGNEAKRTTA